MLYRIEKVVSACDIHYMENLPKYQLIDKDWIINTLELVSVLSHQMGVFQWVWFKKSEHHSIMWEDFNRHRKKSNKILFEWWYFLSIFICIFYIRLSLFCEKILKCHFFYFFPPYFPRFLSIYWMTFKKILFLYSLKYFYL